MDFGPYGNSWWSKKWLETLLEGASEQAIQQGVRYATRGQVSSVDIVDNRVISVVKGPNGGLHNNYTQHSEAAPGRDARARQQGDEPVAGIPSGQERSAAVRQARKSQDGLRLPGRPALQIPHCNFPENRRTERW